MQRVTLANRFFRARYLFFKWRYTLALIDKIALAFMIACMTGFAAQIRMSLPWTPVPITGQTFVVILSGVLLGRWWGGMSQAIYVTMGVFGVPWFVAWSGGYSTLIGPTGGYLIGFIFAALFLGHFIDRYIIKARSFLSIFCLMLFANFVLIHIPGLLQLGLWFHLIRGTSLSLWELLLKGSIPFIIGDMTKIVAATVLANSIMPKESYDGKVDKTRDEW